MNPLDKEELTEILKIIKNDMPIHTDTSAKIKCSFSQGMPKNLKEYSDKVDNKFLNDNLHTIEEMEYRKKGITSNFKEYQNKYYDESGNLNHDLYFKHENKIYPKLHGACGFIINSYSFSAPHVSGAELLTSSISGSTTGFGSNQVHASRATGGTIGLYYNQIKIKFGTTAGGNIIKALYDDSSNPNNLLRDSGSIAMPSSNTYSYQSLTSEVALTTTTVWIAYNNNIDANPYFDSALTDKKRTSQTFPTIPNPYASNGEDVGYGVISGTSHT